MMKSRFFRWVLSSLACILVLALVLLFPISIEGTYDTGQPCLCEEGSYYLFHDGFIYTGHQQDRLERIGTYERSNWYSYAIFLKTYTSRGTFEITCTAYASLLGIYGPRYGRQWRRFVQGKALATLQTKGFIDISAPRTRKIPDPHQHNPYKEEQVSNPEREQDIAILYETLAKGLRPFSATIPNVDGSYVAWMEQRPIRMKYPQDVIVVQSSQSSSLAILSSKDFPHRPISDLLWINADLFCFDIWTGPSYGWHYLYSVSQGKILYVCSFYE